MARPVEGMAAIQRAIDSVSHYLVLKTAISIITGLFTGLCAQFLVNRGNLWKTILT